MGADNDAFEPTIEESILASGLHQQGDSPTVQGEMADALVGVAELLRDAMEKFEEARKILADLGFDPEKPAAD